MFGQMDGWMGEREGRKVGGWERKEKEENAISKQMVKRPLARG